jgi:sugar/nucleoside kinase (ribokinase family)
MVDTRFDVIGVGNAIVDILVQAEDALLNTEGLIKGAMALVDADTAAALYAKVGPAVKCSGGSAANTIAGLAELGGAGAFIGKVHADQLGKVFRHDIKSLGVGFETAPATDGPPTATCLILVTPDAERTMQTYLGACVQLSPADIAEEDISAAQVTYLEGYLWDPDEAKAAFRKAAKVAHESSRQVSLSLSDPFCVDRHREGFLNLVSSHVDILFANEEEIISLYQVASFDEALQNVRGQCAIAALTRGAKGSVIVAGDDVHVIDAAPVRAIVDTTGAGDAFAAGFLYGHTQNQDLATSARIGNIAAAEVISHMGARSEANLKAQIVSLLA